ncbi:SMI1/KNR4 family protein [Paenibacillus mucilaginosus]|uniref:Knr4/Smi1-like domain-containing protein n=2 Tax=Paenibacillus mucilaginosus TaxID=61624 RepID=H6NAP1_9BACL|nr:SMI1/KNR4 family protein [Paenibacillus mucilaginosus]AEI42792.1 hypothetical protein KNP414_04260 [Paenibacillus mucilaginosus KNP414]AFC30517.1 hypothetical protein PM3016_3698 [Paenibacillus mucilaginosus 3016]MCG7216880.1 SMI1/KNR4 family protein [Paenibacillus mucilaginosus]WDM30976.1 SMI1/KNR4 family protein [Paenibacillus mucilaginosus]WFA19143.1 SMI1/KNR4 family protein [Paenibacillus mucilaginosus]
MSIKDYEEAKDLMKEDPKTYHLGPHSDELIHVAEKKLGIKFRGIYRDFLKEYGIVSTYGHQVYGITSDKFENDAVPNAVWLTLLERKTIDLPNNLFIIYEDDFGDYYYCMDFNQGSEVDVEPKVVAYPAGVGIDWPQKTVAEDFGQFLKGLILDTIEL